MSTSRLRLRRRAGALALACLLGSLGPSAATAQTGRAAGSAGAQSRRAAGSAGAQSRGPTAISCSACIVTTEDGQVLWQREADHRLPNASTTKMVTALVAVAEARLAEVATVSSAAGSIGGGAGLDLVPGDQMTVEDLLFASLLSSSNEAAAALAEHVGGSESSFVALMNRAARELGARDTHFVNPHGLDATGHYSTAADLATIGAAVLDDPVLAEIVSTPQATVQTPRGPSVEENRNVLLEGYRGAIGIKTGRTLGAGNVLVAAARRGGHTLIAVAMQATDASEDAAALLDFGFAELRRLDRPRPITVVARGTEVGTLVFDPGGAATIVVAETVTLDLPPTATPVTYELEDVSARPPLVAGQEIGELVVSAAGDEVATVDVVIADSVDGSSAAAIPALLGAILRVVAGVVSAFS